MRLDEFDPNINVNDQGRGRRGGGMGGGMLGMILPLVGRKFGCLGIGAVLVLMVVFGGGLSGLGGLLGGGQQVAAPRAATSGDAATICQKDPAKHAACNAFSSAVKTWSAIFQREGPRFQQPSLQFYTENGQSGCGAAQSAMGPFYCPPDQGVYLDTSFFDELARRYGARGDFAQYYVVAHEIGHHIQTLDGTSDQVRQAQARAGRTESNALQVRMELQADCYAGVWAAQNRDRLDPGDVEEGMTAASAIGDDTLQREAGARVSPESFTHGSSEQRMRWLRRGLESGDPRACDTFGARAT